MWLLIIPILILIIVGNILTNKDGSMRRSFYCYASSLLVASTIAAYYHRWVTSIAFLILTGLASTGYIFSQKKFAEEKRIASLKKFIDENEDLFQEELKEERELVERKNKLHTDYVNLLNKTLEKADNLKNGSLQ